MRFPRLALSRRTTAVAATTTALVAVGLAAAVPDHTTAWIQQFGGTGASQNTYISDVAALPDGSTFTSGSFTETMTIGTTTLTSASGESPVVIKTNADGTNAWAVSAGDSGSGSAQKISAFTDGSAVVSGWFTGTKQFGTHSVTSAGAADIYVAKISSAGTWEWVATAGGTDGETLADVVALSDGSAAITGYYKAAWSIGGTALPYEGTYAANWRDQIGYVAKLTGAGAWTWAVPIPSTNTSVPTSIAAAANGSLYVAGKYRGVTATFGSHTLSSGADQSMLEAFVGKVTTGGTWAWATSTSTSDATAPGQWMQGTEANAITIAEDGDPMVAGNFNGRLTAGSTTFDAAGGGAGYNYDAWVASLSAATGSWEWASRTGGTALDYFSHIAAQSDGAAVLAGVTGSAVTIGSSSIASASTGLVARIGGEGVWESAQSTGLTELRGMSLDSCSSPYIAGWARGTLTYTVTSPSTVITTTPSNRWDGYAAKVSTSACVARSSAGSGQAPSQPSAPSAPPSTPSQAPQDTAPAAPPSAPAQATSYVPPMALPKSGLGNAGTTGSIIVEVARPVTAQQVARNARLSLPRSQSVAFAPRQAPGLVVRDGKLTAATPGKYTVKVIVRRKGGKKPLVKTVTMYVGAR